MPRLVRLYIVSVATGFALSAGFVAALLWLDIAGLGHLVLDTAGGWVGGLMLFVFNGIVFAGAQFGIRVFLMAEDEPPGRPRGGRPMVVPVPVAPGAGRREPRRP